MGKSTYACARRFSKFTSSQTWPGIYLIKVIYQVVYQYDWSSALCFVSCLYQCHPLRSYEPRPCWNPSWNEPSSVPESLLSNLETFEWVTYEGAEEEIEVVAFVFRSAKYLKKAAINIHSKTNDTDKKLEVIKELFSSSRGSPACVLELR